MDDTASMVALRIGEHVERCKIAHRTSYPNLPINFASLDLSKRVKCEPRPLFMGSHSDIFRGQLHGRALVAVKIFRYKTPDDEIYQTTARRFIRELGIWSSLEHRHVAPLLGFTESDGHIGLVSPWHHNGTLVEFVKRNTGASRIDLILDVAEGLKYLHTHLSPLVHGDIKGANVLVDGHGIACLADFGISRRMEDIRRTTGLTTTSGVKGTLPWMAPELDEGLPLTLPSDVYSCAGVFLEICCPGRQPYDYLTRLPMIKEKGNGTIPRRAQYPEVGREAYDDLWQLMAECWDSKPRLRPDICNIVIKLYRQFQLRPRVHHENPLRPGEHCGLCPPATSAAPRPSPLDDLAANRPSLYCPTHGPGSNTQTLSAINEPQRSIQTDDPFQTEDQMFFLSSRVGGGYLTNPLFPEWTPAQRSDWLENVNYSADVITLHRPWTWEEGRRRGGGSLKGYHWTPTYKPLQVDKRGLSVPELWTEYQYGLNGHLSVRELSEKWGILWQRGKFHVEWARRTKITDTISDILKAKITWPEKFALRFLVETYANLNDSELRAQLIEASTDEVLEKILQASNSITEDDIRDTTSPGASAYNTVGSGRYLKPKSSCMLCPLMKTMEIVPGVRLCAPCREANPSWMAHPYVTGQKRKTPSLAPKAKKKPRMPRKSNSNRNATIATKILDPPPSLDDGPTSRDSSASLARNPSDSSTTPSETSSASPHSTAHLQEPREGDVQMALVAQEASTRTGLARSMSWVPGSSPDA